MNRLRNVRLRTVNQKLNLLKRNSISRGCDHVSLRKSPDGTPAHGRRGVNIRMMLNQRKFHSSEIKSRQLAGARQPPNRRRPGHSNAHPTDRRNTPARSTNSARRKRRLQPQPTIQNPTRPRMKPRGAGEEDPARP